MNCTSKIFCIGHNKTGTNSLHVAFKILGLKSIHFLDDNGNEIRDIVMNNWRNSNNILAGIERYDAYSDWGSRAIDIKIIKEFDTQYPDSKFILNTQNLKGWLDSREKHVKRNQAFNAANPKIARYWVTIDRAAWKEHYLELHESIYDYFQDRQDDLLVFDVTKGDGWERLCNFLDMDIPSIPFPRINASPN